MDIIVIPALYLIKSAIGIAHFVIVADIILNLLMFVNIVNVSNKLVYSVIDTISRLADAMLNPIRRTIPTNIGLFDLSPVLLLLLFSFLNNVVDRIIHRIL
jgi:uncharacterized protein YggT (Ycf19 family)